MTDYIPIARLSKETGLHISTLRAHIPHEGWIARKPVLNAVKLGRDWVCAPAEFERWKAEYLALRKHTPGRRTKLEHSGL